MTVKLVGEPRGALRQSSPLSREVVETLTSLLADRFTTNQAICLQHGTDESSFAPHAPDAVAFPLTTDEVCAIVRVCGAYRVPVIAYGVGSSVEGQIIALQGGVCLDLSRMDAVISMSTENLTATVQAGVTREALNRELGKTGFFFSVDPGANASIGGMVATSASGTNTVRYGTMRDNVVNLTVVMADGRVVRTARRARKSSAGYCLTQLFAGSEGTLGIITEVTVRLHPYPECIAAAVVNFPDVRSAVNTVIMAMQMGVQIARAELLDAVTINAINLHSKLSLREAPTLFLEFSGSPAQVREQSSSLQALAQDEGGGEFQWATRPEERTKLWTPRHHAYFACLQLRPGCRSFTTDACVPISSLSECIAETVADVAASGLVAPIFGHVGDGNFHCLLLVDPSNPVEVRKAEEVSARLVRRAIGFDGTCTGEHGIGMGKMSYLEEELGEAAVDVMRRIKRALDPQNILNPGKVIRLTPEGSHEA
jgi:D-lactate dehydrogenase (cytochrome)